MAVLQDLEVLLPPDPQMEASLASLLTNVAFRRNAGSPPPSVRQLLQCAAAVVGLKQRDTMRALRRFKLAEVCLAKSQIDKVTLLHEKLLN